MDFVLIDYQPHGDPVNRDQTGTFGSHFHAGGLVNRWLSRLKASAVRLPMVSFSYAAALLREQGHTVRVVTEMPDRGGDVAIFATVMYHWKEDLRFLEAFKARHGGTRLGVVGAFSQVFPELFEGCCDFVVHGELEGALLAFLEGRWSWEGPFTSPSPVDPETLPLPDWTGFPVSSYSYAPALPKKNFLPVQTARGCAHNCKFCPYMVVQGKTMRYRSPGTVERELARLVAEHGVRSVLFRDILFGVPRARAEEICDRIAGVAPDLEWGCEMRVDSLTEALAERMIASGLKVINLGIETASADVLERSGKAAADLSAVERFTALFARRKVKVQAFYMIGLWHDTAETMMETVKLAKQLNTFSAQFCIATPFPGTAFFEEVRDHLLTEDWSTFTEYRPVVRLPGATSEEIVRVRDHAFRTYYMRPRWLCRYGLEAVKNLIKPGGP